MKKDPEKNPIKEEQITLYTLCGNEKTFCGNFFDARIFALINGKKGISHKFLLDLGLPVTRDDVLSLPYVKEEDIARRIIKEGNLDSLAPEIKTGLLQAIMSKSFASFVVLYNEFPNLFESLFCRPFPWPVGLQKEIAFYIVEHFPKTHDFYDLARRRCYNIKQQEKKKEKTKLKKESKRKERDESKDEGMGNKKRAKKR